MLVRLQKKLEKKIFPSWLIPRTFYNLEAFGLKLYVLTVAGTDNDFHIVSLKVRLVLITISKKNTIFYFNYFITV